MNSESEKRYACQNCLSSRREMCLILIYFFSIGQEFIPSTVYKGQDLMRPVTRGITPIQPHGANMPVAAKVIKTTPTMIRNALSILPTLTFMGNLLLGLVESSMIIKFPVNVDYSENLMICLYKECLCRLDISRITLTEG